MSIVLSASVRQNLLSLQSTADLLATTQNRLSTGKKVNTALDNPTNFFTAQSLDSRASDINNLLDGIGNGVQVLQAANTGITSLQKLVDSAKSIANQALQAPRAIPPSRGRPHCRSPARRRTISWSRFCQPITTFLLVNSVFNNRSGRPRRHSTRHQAGQSRPRTDSLTVTPTGSRCTSTARPSRSIIPLTATSDHRFLGQRHDRHRRRQHGSTIQRRAERFRQHHRHDRSRLVGSGIVAGKLLDQHRHRIQDLTIAGQRDSTPNSVSPPTP